MVLQTVIFNPPSRNSPPVRVGMPASNSWRGLARLAALGFAERRAKPRAVGGDSKGIPLRRDFSANTAKSSIGETSQRESNCGRRSEKTDSTGVLRQAQDGSPFDGLRANAERSRMHSKDGERSPELVEGRSPELVEGRSRTISP